MLDIMRIIIEAKQIRLFLPDLVSQFEKKGVDLRYLRDIPSQFEVFAGYAIAVRYLRDMPSQ
jgi:hypothetical protein